MGGIFITQGMQLRIPQGGLTLRINDQGAPEMSPLRMEVALEIWPFWLDIAVEQAERAIGVRDELTAAAEAAGEAGIEGEQQADLLVREFKAGVIAIAAVAFALDNLQAVLLPHAPRNEELTAKWAMNHTSRHQRISETLRRTFKVSNSGGKQLRLAIQEIFKFRDWAVHQPAGFREPVSHDYLDTGVEWRFVAFSATNAARIAERGASMISQCIDAPRTSNQWLVEWCERNRSHSPQRWERAKALLSEQSTEAEAPST